MSFDLAACRLDATKLESGVWCSLRLLPDGRLSGQVVTNLANVADSPLVRVRTPGVEYTRAIETLKRTATRDLAKLTDDEDARIVGTALVTGNVLVEWKNFVIDGKAVPWSREAAIELLSQRRWENLRGVISAIADNRRILLERQDEDDLGNSSAGSNGQSNSPAPTGSS